VKVLVVSRLFSGFIDAFNTGDWPPAGSPAIYKLLEGFADDRDCTLDAIFTIKDQTTEENFQRRDRTIPIPRLRLAARVLRFRKSSWWREALHSATILLHIFRTRPDVVYFTNANFIAASLAARFGMTKSVLRFMGLFPHEKSIAEGNGRALVRWLYRAPFAMVLCTEEGSGAQVYLPKLLNASVPLHVVINGVDAGTSRTARDEFFRRHELPTDRALILFVGRLEEYKGTAEFCAGLKNLLTISSTICSVVVIGDGSMRPLVEASAADVVAGGGVFRFFGGIPHDEVLQWYRASDVYVSLNKHGNLSNANLEAIVSGVCLVLPESDPNSSTDLVTDNLIPKTAAVRLPREDLTGALTRTVADLASAPEDRAKLSANLRQVSPDFIQSWADRISWELDVLKALSQKDRFSEIPNLGHETTIRARTPSSSGPRFQSKE